MEAQVDQRLRDVIARTLGISHGRVEDDARAEQIDEWDSLGHLSICMAIEQEFGVRLALEEIPTLASVPALRARLTAS